MGASEALILYCISLRNEVLLDRRISQNTLGRLVGAFWLLNSTGSFLDPNSVELNQLLAYEYI
jgi:hypothetical protein